MEFSLSKELDHRFATDSNRNFGDLHWQVSHATSLVNVVVEMSTASGNEQQGEVDSGNIVHS